MAVIITKVEIRHGVVTDVFRLSNLFFDPERAWKAATEHAMQGSAWGMSEERSFVWTRESKGECRFYVHQDNEAPDISDVTLSAERVREKPPKTALPA